LTKFVVIEPDPQKTKVEFAPDTVRLDETAESVDISWSTRCCMQCRYDGANKFIVTEIRQRRVRAREINHSQPARIYTASLLPQLMLKQEDITKGKAMVYAERGLTCCPTSRENFAF